ncbi:hypothetical protein L228DRAFT_242604 [Xylona heveae TC161]|uniref:DUF3020 domain-containing protein n=1 Tax=Xylona heveae (strain CBS 132557 / TC161) TaxID=1328760 RepID=A0A165JFT7_XYLHT|nr:hypothetical protein L228DRAFT_242604 [Xylona heveae TC161]KZF26178.1 hypothetical protein L228DRAFT_242604 [Xylona heveae TC161]
MTEVQAREPGTATNSAEFASLLSLPFAAPIMSTEQASQSPHNPSSPPPPPPLPESHSPPQPQHLSDDEHRSKRIKVEEGTEDQGVSALPPALNSTNDPTNFPSFEQSHHTPDVNEEADTTPLGNGELDIAALANQAAESAIADLGKAMELGMAASEADSHDTNHSHNEFKYHTDITRPPPSSEIDFSSAPSDPTELALWVAKQISNIGNEDRDSMGFDDDATRRKMLSHPPAAYNRRFDDDDDPIRAAERERVREENRERKQRWRKSNYERNKDNDLRCRINRRAKKLYGIGQSPEKAAWMESEFNKRRTKRETKEQIRSYGSDSFTGFSLSPNFGNTLFPAPGVGPNGDTNAAGLLLANALLGVGKNGAGPNIEAANALKAALEGGSVDPRPFTEALRTMASNPEIMNGINAVLGLNQDDEGDTNSGDENGDSILPSTEQRALDLSDQQPVEFDDDSSEIIKALNAATAILNEMNESHLDPPTNRPPDPMPTNGFTAINDVKPEQPASTANPAASNDHGLDQSQIDALLALANGGTLSADPDENAIIDPHSELSAHDNDHSTPQPDSDISATLQRIVQQLMAEQNAPTTESTPSTDHGYSEPHDPHRQPPVATNGHHFGANPQANNHAATLSTLLNGGGMSINTVIPAAQSHATSQLYARLSSRARSSTPSGGGINPAHASAYGSTAQMNQRMRARLNATNRALPNIPTGTPKPSRFGAPPPDTPQRAAESKRIKSFGFPPLPGNRLGLARGTPQH